jgi:hypothetical protein
MDNNILNSIYVGHVKTNIKGGFKIVNDTEDKNIIKKRNIILSELSNVFKGGKELMYEDIPYYTQALEGKYIRNKMCKGGSSKCKEGCNFAKKSYNKLIKKSLREFNNPDLLDIIKGGSPYLFKKIDAKHKIVGGVPSDQKVDDIAYKIMELDNECNESNCKIKMRELAKLRGELNNAWVNSSYCRTVDNCNVELSKYIISITPNFRNFRENINSESVDTGSLSPREVISKFSSRGGKNKVYDYYTQKGGDMNDLLLEKLRIEINKIRFPDTGI